MRKILSIVLILISALLLTACDGTTNKTDLYKDFLNELKSSGQELFYSVHDIDGDGVDDLIIKENTKLTVYTFNDSVTKIDEYDFVTGTARFFYSTNKKYSGIFYFTVGGGANHYGYMTVKDNELHLENLWEEYYAEESPEKVKELSSDKESIAESKSLYQNNKDILFLDLKK